MLGAGSSWGRYPAPASQQLQLTTPSCYLYLQVKGLEFNSFSPNLLASGAADGELCIWDVANPAQPSLYPALKVRCTCPSCQAGCTAAPVGKGCQWVAASTAGSGHSSAELVCKCSPLQACRLPRMVCLCEA
jgi:hypothetical protein